MVCVISLAKNISASKKRPRTVRSEDTLEFSVSESGKRNPKTTFHRSCSKGSLTHKIFSQVLLLQHSSQNYFYTVLCILHYFRIMIICMQTCINSKSMIAHQWWIRIELVGENACCFLLHKKKHAHGKTCVEVGIRGWLLPDVFELFFLVVVVWKYLL